MKSRQVAAACILLLGITLPAHAVQKSSGPALEADGEETLRRGEAYYHLMRAAFAARRGRLGDALTEIRRANRAEPNSPDLLAESANLLMSLGQVVEAEGLAREALELDSGQRAAMRLLAEIAASRGVAGRGDPSSRAEAIRLYETLAKDPDVEDEVLRVLADLHFQDGNIDGAVAVARRLAQQREGDVLVVEMLAQILRHDGRQVEALEALLDYLRRFGSQDSVVPMISQLARQTDQWEAVAAACEAWLADHPDSQPVRKLRVQALLQTRRFLEAVTELERTLEASPQDLPLQLQLATVYTSAGRLADGAALAAKLAEAYPGEPRIHALRADALSRQGNWEEALAALSVALDGFTAPTIGSPERRDMVRRRMATVHLEQRNLEQAKQLLEEVEEPEDAEALELRIRVALAGEDYATARRLIGDLRASKETGLANFLEGELLVLTGRTAKARARFKAAAEEIDPSMWIHVGQIWREAEQVEEGERALRRWVSREPGSAQAHFGLADYLERTGRFEEAEQELEKTLGLEPDHAEALNYLGYSLADRNERLDEALGLILRALEIDPWNGAFLDSLGWVYYRLGRYEEARDPLERAAREYPHDAVVLEHLGDLYAKIGEHELALAMWRRALDSHPDDPGGLRSKIEAGELQAQRSAEIQADRSGVERVSWPPRHLSR